MVKLNRITFLILCASLVSCTDNEIGVMKFPDGQVQHIVRHGEVKWLPCPPHLPAGCEISILEGHPKKADLFTVRFKVDDTFFMRSHTHPKDERVTIIAGNVSVAFGRNAKHEDAKHFKAGDYYINARNSIHTVWIDSPSIIQITGIGPWEANFVNNK
ncbi:MAG: hypothetical protein HFP81_08255 [Methylococcales symbiont of Hymedesmia sp. n. MRB-2018]|nr:MAG: hypothetical protein HFP78_08475 [Methylococcales symbiont of Hymedesmia sp. n. MRB-2018]KAF3983168.1 MAG: hypothetical protein HFP81_08255 [Methylococcales symbiont of Hymedesmia sp. n. MRB-2018]